MIFPPHGWLTGSLV
ncbi:Protein of unknown function [Bacillus mycoides]|nr:Protein of unknown function [Bacillus mycoides]